jgi:hypothetical protein
LPERANRRVAATINGRDDRRHLERERSRPSSRVDPVDATTAWLTVVTYTFAWRDPLLRHHSLDPIGDR